MFRVNGLVGRVNSPESSPTQTLFIIAINEAYENYLHGSTAQGSPAKYLLHTIIALWDKGREDFADLDKDDVRKVSIDFERLAKISTEQLDMAVAVVQLSNAFSKGGRGERGATSHSNSRILSGCVGIHDLVCRKPAE